MNEKMNVLVMGPSGAGKSTLIKAISGKEVKIGIGESQTQNLCVYESDIWPLKLIDTKGFEYSVVEKFKTVNQVRKFTKKQIKDSDDNGIDAIWYCIDGMTGRVFFENIKSMSKAIKGWNNIPIFAVITKSIIDGNTNENIKAVQNAFAKSKGMNLKNIIPIVAEEYKVSDDNVIAPFGLEQLCEETLECYDEAKNISKENKYAMILSQKRFTSQSIIAGASAAGLTIGVLPIPSSPVLVPLEVTMIQSLFKVYGVKIEKSILISLVSTGFVSTVGRSLAEAGIKLIPGTNIVYGVVAAALVTALGESTVVVAENIYTGKIDAKDIDSITKKITDGVKDNPLINTFSSFFTNNKDKIDGKSAKEVFDIFVKSTKKK